MEKIHKKLVIAGDAATGKTSLMEGFMDKEFIGKYVATPPPSLDFFHGVKFKGKTVSSSFVKQFNFF